DASGRRPRSCTIFTRRGWPASPASKTDGKDVAAQREGPQTRSALSRCGFVLVDEATEQVSAPNMVAIDVRSLTLAAVRRSAVAGGGEVRLAGRVQSEPEPLALFAQSLGGDDEIALEATGNALEIARIIEPHVARVVLANPKAVKGITRAGAKTDKIDARTLAQLLAGGFLPAVWPPDEQTRILRRRISARAQLVRQRTRANKPGARDADPQPEGQAAGERSVRRPRTPLAGRARPPGR